MLGIIAGSRVANIFEDFKATEDRIVSTPYGAITVTLGEVNGSPVALLPGRRKRPIGFPGNLGPILA